MEETRLLHEIFFPFLCPLLCSGSAFLADLGRRRCCDTPTMPPKCRPGVGNGYTWRKRSSVSRGSDKSLPEPFGLHAAG